MCSVFCGLLLSAPMSFGSRMEKQYDLLLALSIGLEAVTTFTIPLTQQAPRANIHRNPLGVS